MSELDNYRLNLILAYTIFSEYDTFDRSDLIKKTYSHLIDHEGKRLTEKSWSEKVSKYIRDYFSNFLEEEINWVNKSKIIYERKIKDFIMSMFLIETEEQIFIGSNDTWIMSLFYDLVAGGSQYENYAIFGLGHGTEEDYTGIDDDTEDNYDIDDIKEFISTGIKKEHSLKDMFMNLFDKSLMVGHIGTLDSFIKKFPLVMQFSDINNINNLSALIALMFWEKYNLANNRNEKDLDLIHVILRIATNFDNKPGYLSLDESGKSITMTEHQERMKLINKIGPFLKTEYLNKKFIDNYENLPQDAKDHFKHYFEEKYQKLERIYHEEAIKKFEDLIVSDLSHTLKLEKRIKCKDEIIKNLIPEGIDEVQFLIPTLRYDITSPILIQKDMSYFSENFRYELLKFANMLFEEEIRCRGCRFPLKNINLGCYIDEENGLLLNKDKPRIWVIIRCNYCGNEYSFTKLHESRKNGKIRVFSNEEIEKYILNNKFKFDDIRIEESDFDYHSRRLNDLQEDFKGIIDPDYDL